MLLPSVEQYSIAIEQKDLATFSFLHDYDFLPSQKDASNPFCFYEGRSAAIFKAARGKNQYAIRCFLKAEQETFRRYELLARYLAGKELEWKADFEFIDQELYIEGQRYPILKMEWVEALHLNHYIDEIASDPARLSRLQDKFITLSENLEKNCISHGDLNFSHVMVEKTGNDIRLRLLDYDSMYISLFEGKKNLGSGSPGFQHPKRLASHFTETIDRFSIWILISGLEAIKSEPGLWYHQQNGPNRDKNLLFTIRDLVNPEQSRLFQRLKDLKNEALQFYTGKLISFCKFSDPVSIEKPVIFGKDIPLVPAGKTSSQEPVPPVPVQPQQKPDIKPAPANPGKEIFISTEKRQPIVVVKQEPKLVPKKDNLNEPKAKPVVEEKKEKEPPLPKEKPPEIKSPEKEEEIVEFKVDKETVQKGDLIILSWKVKGTSKIHISHVGPVTEQIGRKMVSVKKPTNYVLTAGSKTKTVSVNVEGDLRPKKPVKEQTPAPAPGTAPAKKTSSKNIIGLIVLAGIVVVTAVVALTFARKDNKTLSTPPVSKPVVETAKAPLFTTTNVTSFLNDLYASYNSRQLPQILNHYGPSINEYYDSRSISKDSLLTIVNDLFVSPVFYECSPDFKTLQIQPGGNNCKVNITINEKLKKDHSSNTETYSTNIEYILDTSFKIISEKAGS